MDFRISIFVFDNTKDQVMGTAKRISDVLHSIYGSISNEEGLNYIFTVSPVDLPDSDEAFLNGIMKDTMMIVIPRDPERPDELDYTRE